MLASSSAQLVFPFFSTEFDTQSVALSASFWGTASAATAELSIAASRQRPITPAIAGQVLPTILSTPREIERLRAVTRRLAAETSQSACRQHEKGSIRLRLRRRITFRLFLPGEEIRIVEDRLHVGVAHGIDVDGIGPEAARGGGGTRIG